jgi:glycosyltransferase involved in cell wall biosynthesis
MSKKNLLIFMPSVEGGGVEKNFFLVINNLSNKFSNISLITSDKSIRKKVNFKIKLIGPNSSIWQTKSRYPKYFICTLYLMIFLIFNKNTLVFAFQANLYAILISKIFRKKVITRSNASSVGWSKNIFKKFIYKVFLRLSDQVIVNSYDFKKELDSKFKINSTVIFNPLNKFEIQKKSREKLRFNFYKKNKIKLITVGRLVDQKDQLTLLKAINLIKNKNIQLVIIGNGDRKNNLIDYILKKKISSLVKIIPYKMNPFSYIKKADIFVLTSKFEGLPNVLLEALALKKYVISTNCPTGPREILLNGHGGDLVKIGDYKALSKKIINCFTKENKLKNEFNKKINLGYHNLNRFDYDLNMKKYHDIIKKYSND